MYQYLSNPLLLWLLIFPPILNHSRMNILETEIHNCFLRIALKVEDLDMKGMGLILRFWNMNYSSYLYNRKGKMKLMTFKNFFPFFATRFFFQKKHLLKIGKWMNQRWTHSGLKGPFVTVLLSLKLPGHWELPGLWGTQFANTGWGDFTFLSLTSCYQVPHCQCLDGFEITIAGACHALSP